MSKLKAKNKFLKKQEKGFNLFRDLLELFKQKLGVFHSRTLDYWGEYADRLREAGKEKEYE